MNEVPLSEYESLDLLSATTVFMGKAGQLEELPVFYASNEITIYSPSRAGYEEKTRELRRALLREEYSEYLAGENANDPVEIADGLLDIIVIAWGNLLAYFGEEKVTEMAREVFMSNLAKVIGEGLPVFRADGKVLKPDGWTPPDIASIVNRH